jgi:hypothetical protein
VKHELEHALGVECAWPPARWRAEPARPETWNKRIAARFAAAWPRIARRLHRGSERGKRS